MESISRLAGGVAHDFNNLLQAITGFGAILMDEMDPADPHRADVDEILRAAQRAVGLTRQLLAFSRSLKIQTTPVDLNNTVLAVHKSLRHTTPETIKIVEHLEPALPALLADAALLEQVIVNLTTNASEAMPDGGTLTIRTRAAFLGARPEQAHDEFKPGRYLVLTIEDTGRGITPDVMEHMFEPFYSTKGPGRGTGLGLSVAYGVVRQHGGFIEVQSSAGRGTTMSVYLPVADAAALEKASLAPIHSGENAPEGKGEHILLLEDEKGVRDFAVRILKGKGYKVISTSNCKEARQCLREDAGLFDIFLSDVVLPDGNGLSIADEFRDANPGRPILLCSAYSIEQARSEVIQARGYRFLPKPYTEAALLYELRDLLDQPTVS